MARVYFAAEEYADSIVIKTTGIHLPHRIGEALHRAYKGEFNIHGELRSNGWVTIVLVVVLVPGEFDDDDEDEDENDALLPRSVVRRKTTTKISRF